MAQTDKSWSLRKDPLLIGLIILILVAILPLPFLGYRLLNGGGGRGAVVPVVPTAVPTSTPTPTATPTATPTPTPAPTATPTPVVEGAPLSGLDIAPEQLQWPPIIVMIPSDSDQYGLSQASVVYEVSAEYQIQRFMAIFEQVNAEKLGPIRSSRLYYLEWAYPYAPLYVHWGASPQAYDRLAEIRCPRTGSQPGVYCLHELDGMDGEYPFWRAEVVDIPWNNGFTSSSLLYQYMQEHEYTRQIEFQGYKHKEEALLATRPLTGTISIPDAFRFSVYYTYDRQSNSYLREFRGAAHVDLLTGEQHRAKNVVVMFTVQSFILGDLKGRLEIQTTGEGEAWIFRDGTMVPGRWVKESLESELRFFDQSGQEVAFNRGNIWIEVLGTDQEAFYALGKPAH